MKSNYEPLGKHIRLVDYRNSEEVTSTVLGISIDKEFMPSVANVIGTDLSRYKLISKGLFACNPMHVGRDERLPIALYEKDNAAIVSPAYFMFEIIDRDVLNEEYLMMWFRRPEFDRECWFMTDGSVRGGITWDDLCRIKLPVPSYARQCEIVESYRAITNRIALKRAENDNLLATAQAVYKAWFVEYKPFGGNCPISWRVGSVDEIAEFFDSMRKPLSSLERADMARIYPYYGAVSIVDYVDDYIFDGEYLLLSEDGIYVVDDSGHPLLQHIIGKFWANNHAHILKGKAGFTEDSLYLFLSNTNMSPIVTGAAQPKINQANLKSFPITIPDSEVLDRFNSIVHPLFDRKLNNEKEIRKLETLRSCYLAVWLVKPLNYHLQEELL